MEKKQKTRKTINVSIQKRHFNTLNAILNSWEENGYNLSNEICEAILFKNKSDINPHICTILSTLALIESSLKSQKISKNMTLEEIDSKALEIFNDVITIDIDGNKLTNLLKGVDTKISNQTSSQNSKAKETQIMSQAILEQEVSDIDKKSPVQHKVEEIKEVALTKTEKESSNNTAQGAEEKYSIDDNQFLDIKVNTESSSRKSQSNQNENLKESYNSKNNKKTDPLVWKDFPEEKIGDKKENNISDSIFEKFAVKSDFVV